MLAPAKGLAANARVKMLFTIECVRRNASHAATYQVLSASPTAAQTSCHARLGFGATARMREARAHIRNHAADVVTGKLVLERRHLRVELLTTIRDGP